MPDDIQFTISIPVREEDADNVINAFKESKPYNGPYVSEVEDMAGNIISNPITPAMYVEDCIAFYILSVTKSYLITKSTSEAVNVAAQEADTKINDLKDWIDSL